MEVEFMATLTLYIITVVVCGVKTLISLTLGHRPCWPPAVVLCQPGSTALSIALCTGAPRLLSVTCPALQLFSSIFLLFPVMVYSSSSFFPSSGNSAGSYLLILPHCKFLNVQLQIRKYDLRRIFN